MYRMANNDPGPKGPALVHPGGVIWVITFASSVQMFRRVRFQQPNSTRCVGVAHETDFLSPVLVFSCNQISVQADIIDRG